MSMSAKIWVGAAVGAVAGLFIVLMASDPSEAPCSDLVVDWANDRCRHELHEMVVEGEHVLCRCKEPQR